MIFPTQPALLMAPMATVSHAGFRSLMEDWGGCSLYLTEMIHAATHLCRGRYESWYADASPCPERVVYQIVGAEEDDLVAAARSLAERDCAGIDLNMGCSAPLVFRQGAGIAWMADPSRAARLAQRLRKAVGTKLLSMKLRLGETEDAEGLLAVGLALQDAGADFLTLHPRVRRDSLSRPARWSWVTVLRDALTIPVVGNGDIQSFSTLNARARKTPADAYMVGRRAVAAPWSFRYWSGRWADPAFDLPLDLAAVCDRFHECLERSQPPDFWVTRSRRFYTYFSQNFAFGHRWGAQLQRYREYPALVAAVHAWWDENPHERYRMASSLEG